MKEILTAKHWQIFILLGFGQLLHTLTIEQNPMLTLFLNLSGFMTIYTWPLLVGLELNKLLPIRLQANEVWFIVHAFVFLTSYGLMVILTDGKGFTASGVYVLGVLYVIYAIFHYLVHWKVSF